LVAETIADRRATRTTDAIVIAVAMFGREGADPEH